MRVADYVVDQIYKAGCEHIFLVTGGGAMFLNDAVAAHGKIKPIINHHEQDWGPDNYDSFVEAEPKSNFSPFLT